MQIQNPNIVKECENLAMEDHAGDDMNKDDEVQVLGPVVIFMDYNHFVLKDLKLPNIIQQSLQIDIQIPMMLLWPLGWNLGRHNQNRTYPA